MSFLEVAENAMIPLLDIQGLHKHFSTGLWRQQYIYAVNGIDLRVLPGETLGLVGESGSGKTTLARCALRLLAPTSGSVLFDGVDLSSLSPSALRLKRREFQIVFQDPFASLDARMTVGESLSEPFEAQRLGTKRERERWVRELLAAVALDETLLYQRPALLSGGQQQRVGIARALGLKPQLLIADEPVSALDASVQAQVLNLLTELQQRFGLTLVLISHALPVVRHLCSRVAVMYLGRVVEDAPADMFFQKPKHPYSELLLRCAPVFGANRRPGHRSGAGPGTRPSTDAGETLRGEIPSPASPPRGCTFHPRCPHALPRCTQEVPQLSAVVPNAKVACFLYNQNAASP